MICDHCKKRAVVYEVQDGIVFSKGFQYCEEHLMKSNRMEHKKLISKILKWFEKGKKP